MFWFGASSANSGIIMIMILSPSVKTSKMVVVELEGLEVRGWLLSEALYCLGRNDEPFHFQIHLFSLSIAVAS